MGNFYILGEKIEKKRFVFGVAALLFAGESYAQDCPKIIGKDASGYLGHNYHYEPIRKAGSNWKVSVSGAVNHGSKFAFLVESGRKGSSTKLHCKYVIEGPGGVPEAYVTLETATDEFVKAYAKERKHEVGQVLSHFKNKKDKNLKPKSLKGAKVDAYGKVYAPHAKR